MRWDGQAIGASGSDMLPGLEANSGFVRSVTTPEFAGVTFHEVLAKSALNRVDGIDGGTWGMTINPYRGCSHACVYCFARPTHTWLEFDAGADFDQQIVVKTNVAEVLRRELTKPTWDRHPVALGTNTDPYQRAEGKYRLMPDIIAALADSGTPFSILTKGTLLRRDIPALVAASEQVPVDLAMSIAVYDDDLQQSVEPGTPTTAARLATVRAVRDAGLDCSVFLMPVLPYITDTVAHLDDAIGRAAAAGATSVMYSALHLKPGVKPWYLDWLARTHPDLVPRYRAMYLDNTYAPKDYRRWLAERIRPILRAHRIGVGKVDPATGSMGFSRPNDEAAGSGAVGGVAGGGAVGGAAHSDPAAGPGSDRAAGISPLKRADRSWDERHRQGRPDLRTRSLVPASSGGSAGITNGAPTLF